MKSASVETKLWYENVWGYLRQVTWEGFSEQVVFTVNPKWWEGLAFAEPKRRKLAAASAKGLWQEYISGVSGTKKEAGVAVVSLVGREGCVLRYEHGGRQVYVK